MNPAQLLSHFDRISDTPDANPRLRRFILDLAVRGKLVEQDPRDEPASELLKRIEAEKTRLLKDGKVKQQKTLPPLTDLELSFSIPDSWVWVRLDTLTEKITDGEHLSPNKTMTGMPLLTATHVTSQGVTLNNPQFVSIEDGHKSRQRCDPRRGDILICSRGTIGRCAVINTDEIFCLMGSVILARFPKETSSAYFNCFLSTDRAQMQMRGMSGATAVQALYLKDIRRCPVALPPLAEQKRIVAKVDELMTLCDRLEASREEWESRRDRLAAASLHRLNHGVDADAFREHAHFYFNHLTRLTARGEYIQQLRQTILNLAVRGKLVPQDPNDEPATKLLGQHELFLDTKSEPWKLPSGWAWSSFVLIGETLGGGTPSKANLEFWEGAIPWVSPKDMKVELIKDAQDHISESAVENSSTRLIPSGSLLMVVRGMILAHSFPTAISSVPLTINQDMKAIVPFRHDLIRMLLLLTKGLKPEVMRLVLHSTHGTCKLLTADLFSLPIPIPPLAEQQRIVAKVDELMALCDRLEAQLATTQTESRRLLEALLHEALLQAS